MIIRQEIHILDHVIYRNYSSLGLYIRNTETGTIHTDVNSSVDFIYEETDEKIPGVTIMATVTYPDSSHLIPGNPGFKQDLFNLATIALMHGARSKEIENPDIDGSIPWVIEVADWRLQTPNGLALAASAIALGCTIQHDQPRMEGA